MVLLCTNGLTDLVEDDTDRRACCVPPPGSHSTPQCQTLVDLALERGGPDNITAVMARYRIP